MLQKFRYVRAAYRAITFYVSGKITRRIRGIRRIRSFNLRPDRARARPSAARSSSEYEMCAQERLYSQGTKKTLTKELIWTIDADTPAEMLIYTVLRTDTDAGHLERVAAPFRPIDTFTQAELVQGVIAYVHRGNGNLLRYRKTRDCYSLVPSFRSFAQLFLSRSRVIRQRGIYVSLFTDSED